MGFRPIGGAGAGGDFPLGPAQNVFTGVDRTAAEAARDLYDSNNPGWITSYNNNTGLNIRLEYSDGVNQVALYQVRDSGGTTWLDNSSAIGIKGDTGAAGATGNSYFFTGIGTVGGDVSTRDGFFGTPPNQTLLAEDLPVSVNTGNDTVTTYVWKGEASPAIYDETEWELASVRSGTGSFQFADAYKISSSGSSISLEDLATGVVSRIRVDEIEEIATPSTISNRLLTGEFEVQPIDADTLVDPIDTPIIIPTVAQSLNLGPDEDGQTITFVDLKLTAASVKTNITITLKLNGIVFAEFFYPTATLHEAPDIYRFPYTPPVDVKVGETLEVTTSSTDGAMVFLGRADTQQKWQRVNLVLWDYKDNVTLEDTEKLPGQYALINGEYSTPSAQNTGFKAVYEPTATADTGSNFTGSIGTAGGTSGICTTVGSGTFAQGDLILVSDSRFNNDIFEVEDHTGNTLEIRGVDGTANVEDFTGTDFLYELDSATITKVNVSVLRVTATGEWEQGTGSEAGISFSKLAIGETIYTGDGVIDGEFRDVSVNNDGSLTLQVFDTDESTTLETTALELQDTVGRLCYITTDGGISNNPQFTDVQFDGTGISFRDENANKGAYYDADYSSNFTARSLIDRAFAESISFYTADGVIDGAFREVEVVNSGGLLFNSYDLVASTYTQASTVELTPAELDLRFATSDGGPANNEKFVSLVMDTAGATFTDEVAETGVTYAADYSANWTDRSVVDKEYADFKSLLARNIQTTGLTSGGVITANGATAVDIAAATGFVAELTDPTDPQVYRANFDGVTSYAPTITDGIVLLGYNQNSTTTVIEIVGNPVTQDYRDTIILGGVSVVGGTITNIDTAPLNLGYDGLQSLKDYVRDVMGPSTINGNIISPNGTNLNLDNSGGNIFVLGSNFRNNPEIPDERPIAAATTFSFSRIYRDGSGGIVIGAPVTTVDPENYDDGSGTLATVSSNDWTVQVVYISPQGLYGVAYGQQVFNTITEARDWLLGGADGYDEVGAVQDFVRRAFIIVREGETDLTSANTEFYQEGKFRLGGLTTSGGIAGINNPGGSDTNIQFNDVGTFGGSNSFTWNNSTNSLGVIGDTTLNAGGATVFPASTAALTVKNSGDAVVQYYSPAANNIIHNYGDEASATASQMVYRHSTDSFEWFVGGSKKFDINTNVEVLTDLQITGAISVVGKVTHNNDSGVWLENFNVSLGDFTKQVDTTADQFIFRAADESGGSYSTSSGGFSFETYASVGFAERMSLDSERLTLEVPAQLSGYNVANVPPAAGNRGAMIYILNEVGGEVPAFSDGANWRRTTDRAIISDT